MLSTGVETVFLTLESIDTMVGSSSRLSLRCTYSWPPAPIVEVAQQLALSAWPARWIRNLVLKWQHASKICH